jgi:hypothetical protein
MGQRSQIYIRYDVNYGDKNYKGLIARYFQWNYGESMVSRARYIMETIKEQYLELGLFSDKWELETLRRTCDVDFDKKCLGVSTDLVKEWAEQFSEFDFNEELFFKQDNNDGQVYIDVTDKGIKYCFTKESAKGKPMDGAEYMDWDMSFTKYPNWREPNVYMEQEVIDYTERNIKKIREIAALMTEEELKDFVHGDYTYISKPLLEKQTEKEIEQER